MLRTMILLDVPLMRMPKFAFEPSIPKIVMLFLPLIDSSCAGSLHATALAPPTRLLRRHSPAPEKKMWKKY